MIVQVAVAGLEARERDQILPEFLQCARSSGEVDLRSVMGERASGIIF